MSPARGSPSPPMTVTTETTHGLYVEENLVGKDKYTYFMGGNNPLYIIENPDAATDETLLVVRDSYADSLAPFLTQQYGTIYMMDLRYYRTPRRGLRRERRRRRHPGQLQRGELPEGRQHHLHGAVSPMLRDGTLRITTLASGLERILEVYDHEDDSQPWLLALAMALGPGRLRRQQHRREQYGRQQRRGNDTQPPVTDGAGDATDEPTDTDEAETPTTRREGPSIWTT